MEEKQEGMQEAPPSSRRRARRPKGKTESSAGSGSRRDLAKSLVTRAKQIQEQQRRRQEEEESAPYVYWIACTRQHIGILLTGKLSGVLQSEDWFSTYKEPDQHWPSGVVPHCQDCQKPLRIFVKNGNLVPNRRFVRRLDREEFETKYGVAL